MATELPQKSQFVYSALADPSKYIRLLEVETDPTNERSSRIRISIFTTFFDHAPKYHAVSYAWGNPSEEEEITLYTSDGEKHMTVRRNCAYVLRQLAYFKTTKYYWVDAICINQEDSREKGFQVGMMDRIFRQADCVLACIGVPHGYGQSLIHWFRDFSTACSSTRIPGDSRKDMELYLECSEQWLDGKPAAEIVQFAKALNEVAKLPYFTRVWILQELFLARRLTVFYGFDKLSLSILLYWWQQLRPEWSTQVGELSPLLYKKLCLTEVGLRYVRDMESNDPIFFRDRDGSRLGKAYEDLLLKCALSTATEINEPENLMPLSDILDLCENKLCQDPRDIVYGTLAIGDWRNATTLTLDGDILKPTDGVLNADYNKTPLDLAKDFLPYFNDMIQMVQLLHMLKIIQSNNKFSNTARRWYISSSDHVEYDGNIVSMAKLSNQKHVHVAGGCMQLTNEGPFMLRYPQRSIGGYIGIYDSNDSLRGVASAGVQIEDWIFPTCCSFGLVLRQINAESMFYTVVGRVAWLPRVVADEFPLTAFIFCLGVEDVIVHLMHSECIWEDWSGPEGPSESLQAALNLPFCSEPFSSFAVLMENDHRYLEEDFKDKKESEKITRRLMRDWRCRLLEMRARYKAPS